MENVDSVCPRPISSGMSTNTFDLQIQSTASDGKHTPRELVMMAREEKLSVIAITDHDTIDGVREALLAGGEFGVRIVPGIEMSVEEHGVHILGYGVDYTNQTMRRELGKSRQGRIAGAQKMVENLKGVGFIVEWEDVLKEASGGIVARPHLARAVMGRQENKEKLGEIASVHDFIQKYLTDDNPLYVKRTHISAKDAIALITGAGGVAVWSHPAIHFQDDYDGLENFLQDLVGWGINGMEVFNPSHTEDDAEFVQGLTAKYNLLRTAGSDFHERGVSARTNDEKHSATHVGDYQTFGFSTDDIIPELDRAIFARKDQMNK